ncbi:MAG TPA: lipopolysaccharide biosynthesis protein [Anaerolineales bacterium]
MTLRADATVRNAGLLIALRGLALAGGFVYAAVVPRTMGPLAYGQFALVTSLAVWFELASGLGIGQVIARETPSFRLRHDREGLEGFFGSLVTLRAASGLLAAAAYFILTRLWLKEIEPLVLAAVAAAVVVQSMGGTLYSFFLGLNQAARWGANDVLSRTVPILFLVSGYKLGGLPGACLGLLAGEAVVAGIALWWARPYLSRSGLRSSWRGLAPHLRFALGFYISTLVLAFFQRSGEPMVRIFSGDYAQVGYFGLAYAAYSAAEAVIPQLTMAFAPFLTALQLKGDPERVARWAERLARWLGVVGIATIAGAFLVGEDLVPAVFGGDFKPVWIYLLPLALTLLPQAIGAVTRMLAVVYDRPGEVVRASFLRLALLWAVGPILVGRLGGAGASLAVFLAVTAYAAYLAWRMRPAARFPLTRWGLTVALGFSFVPLIFLRSTWWLNVGLWGAFLVGYAALLLALRLISPDEVKSALQVIRRRPLPER